MKSKTTCCCNKEVRDNDGARPMSVVVVIRQLIGCVGSCLLRQWCQCAALNCCWIAVALHWAEK